jgi:hypothetical protein
MDDSYGRFGNTLQANMDFLRFDYYFKKLDHLQIS